ncbi:MAG: hypothetical protein MI673_05940, partial [Thiotrichales bacterium]|nr:hypothetical protein [Thiotrichales bacterium]
LRFLLTRCTRTELFVSRYLRAAFLVAICLCILFSCICVLSITIDEFQLLETITYGLGTVAVLVVYSLPLLAFMSIFSSLMSGAMSSMLSSSVLFVILLVCSHWWDDDYPVATYLLPNSLKPALYDISSAEILLNMSGLLAYAVVYLCLGWLIFYRRNV